MPRLIRQAAERAQLSHPGNVSSGVDVIGDIAIVRLPVMPIRDKKKIAKELLNQMKYVSSIYEQAGGIEGEFRLRTLKHLAGKRGTMTIHRENGCVLKVDVAKTYFSPRLSTERLRIAESVRGDEKVLNMFAGVGPFSIPIAKRAGARVVSCEVSPYACELHNENDLLNKVGNLVRVINCDAADLPEIVNTKFDRILMPHPTAADAFLATALRMAGRGATVHYYRHMLGRDESEASTVLQKELKGHIPSRSKVAIRKVREVGPRWLEMVADVRLP